MASIKWGSMEEDDDIREGDVIEESLERAIYDKDGGREYRRERTGKLFKVIKFNTSSDTVLVKNLETGEELYKDAYLVSDDSVLPQNSSLRGTDFEKMLGTSKPVGRIEGYRKSLLGGLYAKFKDNE